MSAVVYYGIDKYNSALKDKEVFKKTEELKVEDYTTYTQMGTFGIRLKLIPTPVSVLFSSWYNDLQSRIDAGERLVIFNNHKGTDLFKSIEGFMDFSGLVILIFGFLAMHYGLDAFKNTEQLKRFISLITKKKLVWWMVCVRTIIVNSAFILLVAWILLFLTAFNIEISILSITKFVLAGMLTLTFLLNAGIRISMVKKKSRNAIFYWFFFLIVFLVPWGANIFTEIQSSNLESNYSIELDNLSQVMNFEREFLKEIGVFKSGEVVTDKVKLLIKRYIDKNLKKIIVKENQMVSAISKKAKLSHLILSLFPSTFYNSVSKEQSGQGFLANIEFHKFSIETKERFTKWYLQKKYWEDNPPGKVQGFIKSNENLYFSKSAVPGTYLIGVIINLIWIIGTLLSSLKRYNEITRFKTETNIGVVDHRPGGFTYFLTRDTRIAESVFCAFIEGKNIMINGIAKEKIEIVYLPRLSDYPDGDIELWKSDFLKALEQDKLIFTHGLDDIRAYEIRENNPKLTISEIILSLKKSEGLLCAVGDDIFLFRKAGIRKFLDNDLSIDPNSIYNFD
jgi:hypothetical protein